jgi:hypothetical protein
VTSVPLLGIFGIELQDVLVEALLCHALPILTETALAAQAELYPSPVMRCEGHVRFEGIVRRVQLQGVEAPLQSLPDARAAVAIGVVRLGERLAILEVTADTEARPGVQPRFGSRLNALLASFAGIGSR